MAEKKIEQIQIPIEWHIPEDLKSHYVTNLVVQHTDQEFIISFFEIEQPIVLGSPEEVKSKFKEIGKLRANCIARIIVTPKRMQDFINAMQTNFDRFPSTKKEKEE